jgi:hypothetical protein
MIQYVIYNVGRQQGFFITGRQDMRKAFTVVITGLLCVFAGSGVADMIASADAPQGVSVTGKRYRKNVRHLRLAGLYQGDKRDVYREFGYTPYRLLIQAAGRTTEQWTYYDRGLCFLFDDAGNLIERREIPKDDGLSSFPGRSF